MKLTVYIFLYCFMFKLLFSCSQKPVAFVDLAPEIEKAPEFIPDSPMWRKLASPNQGKIIDNANRTETEELFTCQFSRSDTLNDSQIVDNKSFLYFNGNLDATTIATGVYFPESNAWVLNKNSAIPRFDPLMMGPIASSARDVVSFRFFFGGGFAINEDFPNGIKYFSGIGQTSDISINGVKAPETLLTGVVANNTGYIIENNNDKTLWSFNNSSIFEKHEQFNGNFNGKFLMASTVKKDKKGEFVFLLSESEDINKKTKELYQLNNETFKWIRKGDFPGEDRYNGVFFGIGDNLFYGLGQSKTEAKGYRDIWKYDTITNKWVMFATYPGSGNIKVSTCIVAGKVYIGLGYYIGTTKIGSEKYIGVTDFWEFVPSRN